LLEEVFVKNIRTNLKDWKEYANTPEDNKPKKKEEKTRKKGTAIWGRHYPM